MAHNNKPSQINTKRNLIIEISNISQPTLRNLILDILVINDGKGIMIPQFIKSSDNILLFGIIQSLLQDLQGIPEDTFLVIALELIKPFDLQNNLLEWGPKYLGSLIVLQLSPQLPADQP